MIDDISTSDIRRSKYDIATTRLTEIAAKRMYLDLLLGDYNANYADRLIDHAADHKKHQSLKSDGLIGKETAVDSLPPHVMDYILQPGRSLSPTSFDLIKRDVYHVKIQEQATREESLYEVCMLRKQEFMRKWRNFKSFDADDRATVARVKSVHVYHAGLQLLLVHEFQY